MRYYSYGRYTEEQLEAFLADDDFDEETKKEIQEKLEDMRYEKAQQEEWRGKYEEDYLAAVEELKESMAKVRGLLPPVIKNGELNPDYAPMASVIYYLESSYDDPDTWNASALC